MDEDTKARALRRARQRIRGSATRRTFLVVEARFTSTTAEIAGHEVLENCGVVSAQVVRVANFFENVAVGLRDNVGGRAKGLEELVALARAECVQDLGRAAALAGGNALVGMRIEVGAPTKSVLIVAATGTAVRVARAGGVEADADRSSACDVCGMALVRAPDGAAARCPDCDAEPGER